VGNAVEPQRLHANDFNFSDNDVDIGIDVGQKGGTINLIAAFRKLKEKTS